MRILPCTTRDVALLERYIPPAEYHRNRFEEQQAGGSTYLLAWLGDVPVGHLNLRWTGSRTPEVAAHVRSPELNAVTVWPDSLRSRGIGSALIAAAEGLVTRAGEDSVSLQVGLDNHAAQRLYQRLGYADWGRGAVLASWTYRDKHGDTVAASEMVTCMTKRLGA